MNDFEMDEFGPEIATVTDENGQEHEFEVLDRIETDDGKKYIALTPYYEDPEQLLQDEGELIVLRVIEENDEIWFEAIEDDDEFDEIGSIFEERLAELFDIAEDEEPLDDSDSMLS